MNDAFDDDDVPLTPMEIAADWVDEFAALTPERRDELRLWLQASEENAAAFARIQKTMRDVSLLEAVEGVQASTQPTFGAPQPRRGARTKVRAPNASRRLNRTLIGAGAALAAGAVLLAVVSPSLRPSPGMSEPVQERAYATAVGARSDVALSDRSVVHLNADTRLTVLFSKGARDVRLDRGEAMFDVAHNSAQPFNVAVGGVTVTDVGTVFDVERVMDATEVRVFQGAVSVASPGAPKRALQKGDWLRLDPRHDAVQGRFDPAAYQNWRTDWLQAENMPLKYAIVRLNRYSPEKIALDDASKGDVALTGRFDLRNTDATLTMISALLKLKTVRKGSELHLEDARTN